MVYDCLVLCVHIVDVCIWELVYSVSQYVRFDLHVVPLVVMQRKAGIKVLWGWIISIFVFHSDVLENLYSVFICIKHFLCSGLYFSSLATGMLPRWRMLNTLVLWYSFSLLLGLPFYDNLYFWLCTNTFIKYDLLYTQQKIYLTLQWSKIMRSAWKKTALVKAVWPV